MTDEQIKTVEKAISERPFSRQELHDFKTAAAALLSEHCEMRELLEAAARIELNDTGYGFERDWDEDSTYWLIDIPALESKQRFDSALDAYRAVKKEQKQ